MEGSDFLLAGVLFLFAAVAAVPLASRLGIGAVLGYLLAGIAIGPWGLGFISDVDEIDLMFFHNGIVLAATAQNATMYFRMQGLHASIHHLRETGVIGNFGYRQTFFC